MLGVLQRRKPRPLEKLKGRPADSMRTSYILIAKLVVTVAILAAIAWKLDFQTIGHAFSALAPAAVVAALLVIALQAAFTGIRLAVIVATFGHHIPAPHAVRIAIEGIFFGQTFVSFLGSDALRIWRVRKSGLDLEQAGAAVALDRVLGIIINHALLLISLPWLLSRIDNEPVRLILIALAFAGIAGTIAVLLLGYFRDGIITAAARITGIRAGRIAAVAAQAITAGRHLLHPDPRLLLASAISLLSALCNGLVFFVLLLGWNVDATTALLAALLVPAVLEIAMLPISIGGWGIREGAAVVAFGTLGIPSAVAFGSSVLFALLTLFLGLFGGVSWLLARKPPSPKVESGADTAPPLRAE
jgi:uncharacterized protein (TIRG00374 family)